MPQLGPGSTPPPDGQHRSGDGHREDRPAPDRAHRGGHHHGIGGPTGGADGHPAPASRRFRGRLTAAFALTAALFVAELVVGLLAGSLAVVADSGHLATDVVTLGAALVATRIAVRPDSSGRRTYGRYRAEVFAAGLAVLLMIGVGVFVVAGAIGRVGAQPQVATGPMAIIGIVGLVVNLACLLLLHAGAGESLNVRGAYLEVLGDAAGSLGVLVASGLIAWTGSAVWDVVVAVGIGAFVVVRAVGLGRAVLRVLGQQAPQGMDPQQVADDLAAIDGVADVHDLHLWELTSGMTVATAHLVSADGANHHGVLDRARDVLSSRYHIEHATLQIEPADHTSCRNIDW
jgi:cobalt-zinc-cadmium efflux system protein